MNPPPCVGHAHRHIRSRLNSSEFNDYRLKTDILLAQYAQISETARKFVDRQTQAFYFTLVVYGGVIAAISPMIGSSSSVNGPSALIATIGQMSESQICLILLLTQVAVPLLVFPLLMLFIDAELWMIGVGKTIIQPIRDDFAKFPVQGIRFPDDWTETVSRHVLRQQRVHWHRITTGRLVVFLYGPVFWTMFTCPDMDGDASPRGATGLSSSPRGRSVGMFVLVGLLAVVCCLGPHDLLV